MTASRPDNRRSSTLTVKIKNRSDSAYQHEVYGDTIIVERHFSCAGSSSFRIKSCTGRLVSNRKTDLDDICDYFALQIDNPMNVLTQDMARQFLNNSNPTDKYRFFLKGTQLEQLDGDYMQIELSINQIMDDLEKSERDVKEYEEEARKAKALFVLSEKHDSLRQKIRGLGHQMAWAQVEEQERKVLACEDVLRRHDQLVENTNMEVVQNSDSFDTAHQAMERANAAVVELREGLVPIIEEKEQAKNEFDKFKDEALTSQVQSHLSPSVVDRLTFLA